MNKCVTYDENCSTIVVMKVVQSMKISRFVFAKITEVEGSDESENIIITGYNVSFTTIGGARRDVFLPRVVETSLDFSPLDSIPRG